MPTRSQEEAEAALGPLFPIFSEAIAAATEFFWRTREDDAHRYTTICRANMLRCLIAGELKKRLDGRPGVAIQEVRQTTQFHIGTDWLLMVHKFDEACQSAKNDTQICFDLNDNEAEMIPGLEPTATVVFLGYIENIGDRLNPEMRLTCPDGSKPTWAIDLGAVPPPPPPVEITPPDRPDHPAGETKVVVRQKDRKFSH